MFNCIFKFRTFLKYSLTIGDFISKCVNSKIIAFPCIWTAWALIFNQLETKISTRLRHLHLVLILTVVHFVHRSEIAGRCIFPVAQWDLIYIFFTSNTLVFPYQHRLDQIGPHCPVIQPAALPKMHRYFPYSLKNNYILLSFLPKLVWSRFLWTVTPKSVCLGNFFLIAGVNR